MKIDKLQPEYNRMLSIPKVCKILGMGKKKVMTLANRGEFRLIEFDNKRYILYSSIEEFWNRNTVIHREFYNGGTI